MQSTALLRYSLVGEDRDGWMGVVRGGRVEGDEDRKERRVDGAGLIRCGKGMGVAG